MPLLAYGAATLVGNMIVARLANRHTISTLLIGTGPNAVFLTGLAVFTDAPPLALAFMLGIGLVGVTMNPAMAVRVQRAGSTRHWSTPCTHPSSHSGSSSDPRSDRP